MLGIGIGLLMMFLFIFGIKILHDSTSVSNQDKYRSMYETCISKGKGSGSELNPLVQDKCNEAALQYVNLGEYDAQAK